MDASSVITESFDSLWLFANVLSPQTQPSTSASHENANEIHVKEGSSEPVSRPVLQIQKNECRNAEFEAQIQPETVKGGEGNMEGEVPEARRRRRGRRRRRTGRRILGELEVGLNVKEDYGYNWKFEKRWGNQRIGGQIKNKMPPLNDGVAMKEHLRSWANAVASTVR